MLQHNYGHGDGAPNTDDSRSLQASQCPAFFVEKAGTRRGPQRAVRISRLARSMNRPKAFNALLFRNL